MAIDLGDAPVGTPPTVGQQAQIRTAIGLGSAAVAASSAFATAAQGATADTAVQPGDLAAVATTGDYDDLSGAPTLATVATTGDYSDLLNKPSAGKVATFSFNLPVAGDTTLPAIVSATGTITGYSLLAVGASGAVSIDLWRGASGSVPTGANSILSAPLSTSTFITGNTASFTSTALAAGDILIASATTPQDATSIVLILTVSQ